MTIGLSADTGSTGEILSWLAGTAINQDGRSSSLTAPHGPSQQAVVSAALSSAGQRPGNLQAIELHGTGTSLGDPIELNAALAVLGARQGALEPLTIHAIKSLVGHAEPAAGIVGVCGVLQRLVHHVSAPVHGLVGLNPLLDDTFSTCGRELSVGRGIGLSGRPGMGGTICQGVSAFAFQGTNAHVVLEPHGFSQGDMKKTSMLWDRHRHWFISSPAYVLLTRALKPSSSRCSIETVLINGQPSLYYLWDHMISGRVLFPGAAMLETMSAAALSLATRGTS